MPLRYRSGGVSLGVSTLVVWHEFEDYKVEFAQGAMVESATVKHANGRILAKLTFVDLKNQRARFRETHYATGGTVEFECLKYFPSQRYRNLPSKRRNPNKKVRSAQNTFL